MRNKFSINLEHDAEIPILYLAGDVTAESDEEINNLYNELVAKGHKKILFNFSETSYINSAGMATMLGLITEMIENKRSIKFVGLTPHFKKIMEMIGITDFVSVYDTNKDAIGSFS